MKRSRVFSQGSFLYHLISTLLILVILFVIFPAVVPEARANDKESTNDVNPNIPLQNLPIAEAKKLVNPEEKTILISPRGSISLNFPKGAVSAPVEVTLSEYSFTQMSMVNMFELNAKLVENEKEFSKFRKGLEISIFHSPDQLAGLDLDSLCLYYLDKKSRQWVPIPSQLDRETLTLTATIDHFSYFGEQANPLQNGPGRVMAAEVNLHSGTATYSYPIELPPGPGGFQPSLTLAYNSGSVDDMKNKRDMGSWVGIGWSLNPGRITYDLSTRSYFLEINGTSFGLISIDGTNYQTNPENYYKITRDGNTWEVYDKSGTYYRFGGTSDSEQYVTNSIYYRWDLNYWEDTNGNDASIEYIQDEGTSANETWIRSSYPEYLKYNNNQIVVHFDSEWDEVADGDYVRYDSPTANGTNPAPKIMETRLLDTIEISVNGALVIKYDLDYDYTPEQGSTDYGGINYAGTLTLTSITQVGADGTSTLPPTSFTYQDKQVYRKTNETQYNGNPGNPASLTWPFLTEANNGYGGSVSFDYVQIPDNTTLDIWTRQAITTKTINSGYGNIQTYAYNYTGDPQYSGTGWNQGFRGWNEVKQTDLEGNYVLHYFYTTGEINGQQADYLVGREYKTQWYDSGDNLLKENTYDLSWEVTDSGTEGTFIGNNSGGTLSSPCGVVVSPDEYVYVASYGTNRIVKFDTNLNYVASPFDSLDVPGPKGIAISYDGYIFVACNDGKVRKYDINATLLSELFVDDGIYGVAVSGDGSSGGYLYVTTPTQYKLYKYDTNCDYINKHDFENEEEQWGCIYSVTRDAPFGVAISTDDYIYCVSNYVTYYNYYCQPPSSGGYSCIYLNQFFAPTLTFVTRTNQSPATAEANIAISGDNNIYITATNYNMYIKNVTTGNTFGLSYNNIRGIAVGENYIYAARSNNIARFTRGYTNWSVHLDKVEERTYTSTVYKITRVEYVYDDYGNVIAEKRHGDIYTTDDDATIHRVFNYNEGLNILNTIAEERTYKTITEDVGGANLKAETLYYYDGNNTSITTPPTKGNLTRVESKKDASNSVSSYMTYDTYGNVLTSQDPNGNNTTWTFDTTYHTYPTTKSMPLGLSESYTYDPGTTNLLTMTDFNDNTTNFEYDTFKRLTKVYKPGDSAADTEYQYNNWGTLNQQHIKTITRVDATESLWQSQYFDGLGRVIQIHSQGETGFTIISGTVTFNNRGLVDKEYVTQELPSGSVNGYTDPSGWKYASYTYDALGRVLTQTSVDGTVVSHDYSTTWQDWQDLVTNQLGYKTRYHYDAFQRLIKVEELNASDQIYATTYYEYDTLGNLVEVEDDAGNTTTMAYDWLSRKTSMVDPDMGNWSYIYDNNGNLISQTDAKSQTITMTYDALNRITTKNYPEGSGMTDVTYSYDSTNGGNYGKGLRTGMSDASGSTAYKYDSWDRLIEEKRTISSFNYTTSFTYDGADRIITVTYPTGEIVTQDYNGRGFPDSLSGSVSGDIVDSVLYNSLGMITEINLNNGVTTNYSYWGIDEPGGYYGRLWNINTNDGVDDLIDIEYTWDAAGNLLTREDIIAEETETFTYDFLDRLTGVSGPYSESYTYDEIGNITSRNSNSYTYGTKPHAVTSVGSTSYAYDANGNMTTRGSQTIGWDVENRVISVSGGASFVYDGDGNRIMKTENGETILYINQYYEKNLTTSEVTTYYYLGGQLVAMRQGDDLKYMHQDHLTSTSMMTDDTGDSLGAIKYLPFGETRSGSVPTDIQYTGQKLDGTGLYYYGARYYDPTIGRFISADTIIPDPANPQAFNRYSFCLNNPLKYIDPSGNFVITPLFDSKLSKAWKMVKSVAPDLAEKVDPWYVAVFITWSPFGGEGSICVDFGPTTQISIDPNLKDASLERLASVIAHELEHAAEGRLGTSVQEELIAYQREYEVGTALGLNMENTLAGELKDYDPNSIKDLQKVQERLKKEGNPIYINMPLVSHEWNMWMVYTIGSATGWWDMSWIDPQESTPTRSPVKD